MANFRNIIKLNKHLTSVADLNKESILELFNLTSNLINKKQDLNYNYKKGIGLLFFQPSTRTRMSFEIAAKNIGLNTILESNPDVNTAMAKQETLHDVLKTMSNYVDAIVLRHPNEEEVFENIKNIDIPIINGGWGNFEHPTQALIDLYTFHNTFENLENTKLAIVGDPNTRTSRSISELASLFNMKVSFIHPVIYTPKSYSIPYESFIVNDKDSFRQIVPNFDIVYYSNFTGTSVDDKRNEIYDIYYLSKKFLVDNKLYIYSPLPRRPNEMDIEADNTEYQLSFNAVNNSVFLRMALYNFIL